MELTDLWRWGMPIQKQHSSLGLLILLALFISLLIGFSFVRSEEEE